MDMQAGSMLINALDSKTCCPVASAPMGGERQCSNSPTSKRRQQTGFWPYTLERTTWDRPASRRGHRLEVDSVGQSCPPMNDLRQCFWVVQQEQCGVPSVEPIRGRRHGHLR